MSSIAIVIATARHPKAKMITICSSAHTSLIQIKDQMIIQISSRNLAFARTLTSRHHLATAVARLIAALAHQITLNY